MANAHHVYVASFRGGSGGHGGLSAGGSGGGAFTVLTEGAIVNAGSITANGGNGTGPAAGGGGGGIVILASNTSATNTGTINAVGGNQGGSDPERSTVRALDLGPEVADAIVLVISREEDQARGHEM